MTTIRPGWPSIELPPPLLFVLGRRPALDRSSRDRGRRDAPTDGPRPSPGGPDRGGARVGRSECRVRAGGRHRWCRPRRGGLTSGGTTDRGHRRWPCDAVPAGPSGARGRDRRRWWRRRVGARSGRRFHQGHVPATEPGHQRPVGCRGRRRGAGAQRGTHHRVLGARTGSRLLPRRPVRSTRRRPRAASRSCASSRGGPDRGRHPAAPRRPRAGRAAPGGAARRRRRSRTSGPTAGQVARGLVDGLATVDELVATTGLPVATVLATLTILERDRLAVGRPRSLSAGRDARRPVTRATASPPGGPCPVATTRCYPDPRRSSPSRRPHAPRNPIRSRHRERLLLKVAAAALAVPILIVVYVSVRPAPFRAGPWRCGGRTRWHPRLGVVFAARPAPVAATPPSQPVPLTGAAFGPVVATGPASARP